jgi:hypothetical protein
MKPAPPTPSKNFEAAAAQVKSNTPPTIVELIARQMDRADNAHERITTEGEVVRDVRGVVVPHPAIAIESAATKLIADLISKHKTQATNSTKTAARRIV